MDERWYHSWSHVPLERSSFCRRPHSLPMRSMSVNATWKRDRGCRDQALTKSSRGSNKGGNCGRVFYVDCEGTPRGAFRKTKSIERKKKMSANQQADKAQVTSLQHTILCNLSFQCLLQLLGVGRHPVFVAVQKPGDAPLPLWR